MDDLSSEEKQTLIGLIDEAIRESELLRPEPKKKKPRR